MRAVVSRSDGAGRRFLAEAVLSEAVQLNLENLKKRSTHAG
jgi:hypothetical protein